MNQREFWRAVVIGSKPWWHFWNPYSAAPGGCIAGILLGSLVWWFLS